MAMIGTSNISKNTMSTRYDFHERLGVSLKPLRKLTYLHNRGFMTFDVETKDGLKRKELFCWSLAFYTFNQKKEKRIETISGNEKDLHKMFDFIQQKDKRKSMLRTIFVHNLSFEEAFINDYCVEKGLDTFRIDSGPSLLSVSIKELGVKFVDTMQFLLCEQEKAEIDYEVPEEYRKIDCKDLFNKNFELWSEYDKKRVIEHNKNDVKALLVIMDKFRKTVYDIANVDMLTVNSLASLSMKCFRKTMKKEIKNPFLFMKFVKNKIVYDYEKEEEKFVRNSYYGGRTEVFSLKPLKNIAVIDRVSMFPTQMRNKSYPEGYGYWEYRKNKLEEILDKKELKEGFIEVDIVPTQEYKYPLFPKRIDGKVMFMNCKLHGVYTIPELIYGRELGYEITPIKGFLFEPTKDYFKNFVDLFFDLKQNGKGSQKKVAKIILNSCYGKFGQQFEQKKIIKKIFKNQTEVDEFCMKKFKTIDTESLEELHVKISKGMDFKERFIVSFVENSTMIKPFMNVGIASYTTAHSRIDLHKKYMEFDKKGYDVYYSDTDCIWVNKEALSSMELNHNLGSWDIENEFEMVQIKAPKCYYGKLKGKSDFLIKMKGIPKSKIKELSKLGTMDEIEKEIVKPIEMAETYMKYNESCRNGKIFDSKKLVKLYSYQNTKREFDNEGNSKAYNEETLPYSMKIQMVNH